MKRYIRYPAKNIAMLKKFKVRVLRLISPIEFKNTILGQYGKSTDGEKPGYKDDDSVPEESRCATFCSAIAYVNSQRWDGVPFIFKAAKGVPFPISLCIKIC